MKKAGLTVDEGLARTAEAKQEKKEWNARKIAMRRADKAAKALAWALGGTDISGGGKMEEEEEIL